MNNDAILDKYDEMNYAEVQMSFSRNRGPLIERIVKFCDDDVVGVTRNIPLREYDKEAPMERYQLKLMAKPIDGKHEFNVFKAYMERVMDQCELVDDFVVDNEADGVFGSWKVPEEYKDRAIIGGVYMSEVELKLDRVLRSSEVASIFS